MDGLIQDILQRRAKVDSKNGASETAEDYAQVWSTFVNYVKSCMEQKRGLILNSFCKVGWLTGRGRQTGKSSYKPFFQFTDQFVRAYLSQEAKRKHDAPPQGDLCPFEDFNFSKAAIKFSQQLTKDQVFSMLKAIVQRLGEIISEGKEVDIAMGDVGRLSCRGDRDPRFSFSPDIYAQEGLDAPHSAADEGPVKTTNAFSKNAPPEAQMLGIRNSMAPVGGGYSGGSEAKAQPLPRVQEYQEPEEYYAPPEEYYQQRPDSGRRGLVSSGSAPSLMSAAGGLTATQFKKEIAYKEAMDRHIMAMEAKAQEVVAEKDAQAGHVNDCLDQEREEIQSKRERNHMNLHFIKHQMQMGEIRKKEQRIEDIESASAHLTIGTEVAPSELKEWQHGQRARVRQELDDQVRTNNTLRNLAKQRERNLELNQLDANKQEMLMLRNAERAKKAYDREALATAWNSEIRMKNIWKAIESHNKVGPTTHQPQVMLTNDLPPSRGGSVASAGRLLTGSSRRVPLGCSSSLSMLEGRAGSSRGIM